MSKVRRGHFHKETTLKGDFQITPDHSFSSSIEFLSHSRMSGLPVVNCSSSDTATVDDDAHSRHLSNFPMLIKCSASV